MDFFSQVAESLNNGYIPSGHLGWRPVVAGFWEVALSPSVQGTLHCLIRRANSAARVFGRVRGVFAAFFISGIRVGVKRVGMMLSFDALLYHGSGLCP